MSEEFIDEGATCVAFLGPREIAKRRRFGMVAGGVAVGAATLLLAAGAPRLARAAVFVPAVLAGFGLLQAREKT